MILEYEEKILTLMDEMVSQASDDELFASGYLRGHISLAAAECEQNNIDDLAALKMGVLQSLKDNANELNPADQALVRGFWLELQNRVNESQ